MRKSIPELARAASRSSAGHTTCAMVATVLIGLVFLIGGCGGDKDEVVPDTGTTAMVPDRSTPEALTDSVATLSNTDATLPAEGNSIGEGGVGESAEPVVEPATPASDSVVETKPVVDSPAKMDGRYSLQLGSFQNRSYAQKRSDQVQAAGFEPVIEPADVAGITYYRVLVRGFSDRASAENIGEGLLARLGTAYLIKQDD